VINHVSNGKRPEEIMLGAMESLIEKSVRLMKRVQMEPEFTLVGGIMRFPTMVSVMREHLAAGVNVPPEPLVQYTGAIGAALLARRRYQRLQPTEGVAA
jgi:activator of 2-hydroxyglutaryl-CoA dehydratase